MSASNSYCVVNDGRKGMRSVCTCGWRSPLMSSGGLAGAVWDQHRDEKHPKVKTAA